MASGVLVFDEAGGLSQQVLGESGQAFVVLDETSDVLVFDGAPSQRQLQEASSGTDFIIFDTPATIAETLVAPADFLLVDPPKAPATVGLGPELADVIVISPGGPPGPAGEQGPAGPPGEPGQDGPGVYYEEFNFATAEAVWTLGHNQGSLGLNVETVDNNGEPIEGNVRFIDPNTIQVEWYFPMMGKARVFR